MVRQSIREFQSTFSLSHHRFYGKREGLCLSVRVSLPTLLIFPAEDFLTEKNGFSPTTPKRKYKYFQQYFTLM